MMKILALDTSSAVCSVAVSEGDSIKSEINVDCRRTHSELLMPLVEACMNYAGWKAEEIDLLAVSAGPGSFTGVRIGMCAAKAMAQALGRQVAVVDTLEALAQNAAGFGGVVCPIIDARKGQVYYAAFQEGQRLWEDGAGHIDQVLQRLEGRQALFVGDGAVALREYIAERLGDRAVFAPGSQVYQRAAAVAVVASRMAEEQRLVSPEEAVPNYVRESGAVRKKMGK